MAQNIGVRLLKGTLFTGSGNFLDKISSLLVFVVVVRLVSKDEVGAFVLVLLFAEILNIFNNLALDELGSAKMISSTADQKEVISCVALTSKFLISFLIISLLMFSFPLFSRFFNLQHLNYSFLYVAFIFLSNCLIGMLLRILQGWHKYKEIALAQSFLGLLRLCFAVIFVLIFDYGIYGLLNAYLSSYLITVIILFYFLPFKYRPTWDYTVYKQLFLFGLPLGMNNGLTLIFNKVDRFLITWMIGAAGLAVYETASKASQNVRLLYNSFNYVFFPNISELYSEERFREAEEILNNSIRVVSILSCFIALFTHVFRFEITTLIFSKKYAEGAPILSILTFALCVALVSNLMGTSLVALGHSDKPIKANIVEAVTNIVANLILIPAFGLIGAAFATILSRCATNPVNFYFLRNANVAVKASQYLMPLLVCGIIVALNSIISPTTVYLKICMVLIFPVACYAFSVIKKSDIVYIHSILKRMPRVLGST